MKLNRVTKKDKAGCICTHTHTHTHTTIDTYIHNYYVGVYSYIYTKLSPITEIDACDLRLS